MKTDWPTAAPPEAGSAPPCVHPLPDSEIEGWEAPRFPDVAHTVRLLALIANDEAVRLENQGRVVEALQNHGHLLCEEELEVIRLWLGGQAEQGGHGRSRTPRTRRERLRWD